MKFLNEFKEFAVKGNMVDMAIGVIIGASFNKVVDVLVKHIIMPPLSLLTNNTNLKNKKIILREASETVEQVYIDYGLFFETLLDFLIIGLTIFIVVKFLNRLRSKAEDHKDTSVTTPKNIELLSKMNDLLEEQNNLLKQNKPA